MILSYCDLLGDGKRHRVKAKTTTEHSASSYNQPVIVLEDGNALDLASWAMLGYQIEQASDKERADVNKIFSTLGMAVMADQPDMIRVTTAARLKNVSRATVYYAIASGTIDIHRVENTIHVVDNDRFKQWTPRTNK